MMTPVLAPMASLQFDETPVSAASLIEAVNRGVNESIAQSDTAPGTEAWQFWPHVGFCHDYAITKQKILAGLGIKSQRCEVTLLSDGERHMVLLVGDQVLDSINPVIVSLELMKLHYKIVRTQDADNPRNWFAP
jgi:predicted transglutaminase-like cysteine proteinase